MGRYAAFTQRLLDSVLDAPGHTSSELRRAALARAARPGVPGDGLAAPLGRYVDTVARHAYKLTDDDLTAVRPVGMERRRARAVRRVHVAPEPMPVLNGCPRRGRVAGP